MKWFKKWNFTGLFLSSGFNSGTLQVFLLRGFKCGTLQAFY